MSLEGRKILVTGCAGFIGAAFVQRLLKEKDIKVIGIDNLNNYYNQLLESFERTVFSEALRATKGRRIACAKVLNVGRNTVTKKIQDLDLPF